jgi:hypothetical protein
MKTTEEIIDWAKKKIDKLTHKIDCCAKTNKSLDAISYTYGSKDTLQELIEYIEGGELNFEKKYNYLRSRLDIINDWYTKLKDETNPTNSLWIKDPVARAKYNILSDILLNIRITLSEDDKGEVDEKQR